MTKKLRRSLAGVVTAGALALAAGCGGGDDPLSADEFRTQADAICADINRASDAIDEPTGIGDVMEFLRQTRSVLTQGRIDLEELTPPEEFQSDWDGAIELQEEQLRDLDEIMNRIAGGADPETVLGEFSSDLEGREDRLREIFSDLGLTECGRPGDAAGPSVIDPVEEPAGETTTPEPAPDSPSGDTAGPTQYLTDVQDTAGALTRFGTVLQGVGNSSDLEAVAADARAALVEFDAGIARLGSYSVEDPTLEGQRSRLAAEGPRVSEVLNRFVDALASNDLEQVQALLPEVTSALQAFGAAARG